MNFNFIDPQIGNWFGCLGSLRTKDIQVRPVTDYPSDTTTPNTFQEY